MVVGSHPVAVTYADMQINLELFFAVYNHKQVFEFEKSRFAQVFVVKNSQTFFQARFYVWLLIKYSVLNWTFKI